MVSVRARPKALSLTLRVSGPADRYRAGKQVPVTANHKPSLERGRYVAAET